MWKFHNLLLLLSNVVLCSWCLLLEVEEAEATSLYHLSAGAMLYTNDNQLHKLCLVMFSCRLLFSTIPLTKDLVAC